MQRFFKRNKKGITLVELVVTMGIIVILGTFLISITIFASTAAKDDKILSDATEMANSYVNAISSQLKRSTTILLDGGTSFLPEEQMMVSSRLDSLHILFVDRDNILRIINKKDGLIQNDLNDYLVSQNYKYLRNPNEKDETAFGAWIPENYSKFKVKVSFSGANEEAIDGRPMPLLKVLVNVYLKGSSIAVTAVQSAIPLISMRAANREIEFATLESEGGSSDTATYRHFRPILYFL